MSAQNAETVAVFNDQDQAIAEGWAAYHERPMRRWRFRCWLGRHAWPAYVPEPPNGHSPSNYARCARCQAAVHWYVLGQHRWGGINAHIDGDR